MSKLRRFYKNGNVFFVTNVTYERKPILLDNADILKAALRKYTESTQTELIAWVIMPDHFHTVIDTGAGSLSDILHRVKLSFASSYRKQAGMYRGRVWQNRFWDHVIRDQSDLNKHIDYIHYNPVRHGLVQRPLSWKHSSIHEYAEDGVYRDDWGVKSALSLVGEFGE
jgi:putative transposase